MTYKDLFELIGNINFHIGDQTTKAQKKLFKVYEKVKHFIDEYQAKVDDLRLDYASVDDKGNIIMDEKGKYKYTKDKLKEFNAEFKKLEAQEIEVKKIEVLNPSGLEDFNFLENWVTGVIFNEKQKDEEEEL